MGAMTTPAGHAQPCMPDLVIVNAKVHTVDAGRPSAEAVAVCGGNISAVGTTASVRALAGPQTRVIDAAGRLVVPGFNDAHVHLIDGANEIVGVDLRPATNEQDLARMLRAHAATIPKGRWIVGGYWDHDDLFAIAPKENLQTRALITIVGGRVVHDAGVSPVTGPGG